VLRKRLVVLVAAAVMVLSMLAAPVFAQGEGGCDASPGNVEMSKYPVGAPPTVKAGAIQRDPVANEKDPSSPETGFGERVDESA
jgi:hypothetical protein